MCEYCEGVEGKPLPSDNSFIDAIVKPHLGMTEIDCRCARCDAHSLCYARTDFCPMCGRDLREGER